MQNSHRMLFAQGMQWGGHQNEVKPPTDEKAENARRAAVYLADLKKIYNDDFLSRKRGRWDLYPMKSEILEGINEQSHPNVIAIYEQVSVAMSLCALFPQELFIAGGCATACVSCHKNNTPYRMFGDVDFFFVCESEQRAISIIRECIIRVVRLSMKTGTNFMLLRSNGALSIMTDYPDEPGNNTLADEIDSILLNNQYKFQFIHRLYSHYSQIPGMFDLGPCQFIYSHERKFEATRMGKYCLENGVQFLDPSRRSTTFASRVEKYGHRGYQLVIPNVKDGWDPVLPSATAKHARIALLDYGDNYTAPGLIRRYKHPNPYKSHWSHKKEHDSHDYQETIYSATDFIRPLYPNVPLTGSYPMLVDNSPDFLVNVALMKDLNKCYHAQVYPNKASALGPGSMRAWATPEEIPEFIKQCYTDSDEAANDARFIEWCKAKALQREEALRNHFRPYSEGGFFRIANPGEQGGGSNHPTVLSGRDFWNLEHMNPILVGIEPDVYVVMRLIWRQYTANHAAPFEIFKMLCVYVIRSLTF